MKRRIFRVSHLGDTLAEDIREIEKREKLVSASICLPIEIATDGPMSPIPVGYALGDQGCIHTLIRRSHKDRVLPKVVEQSVDNHYVVGATSDVELPVSAKFPAILSSNGKILGNKKTVIYIVEDKGNNSIMCDLIIGRPTIAESDYHCIDTRAGTLFNKESPSRQLQCSPACLVETSTGGVIMPKELRNTMKSVKSKGPRQLSIRHCHNDRIIINGDSVNNGVSTPTADGRLVPPDKEVRTANVSKKGEHDRIHNYSVTRHRCPITLKN